MMRRIATIPLWGLTSRPLVALRALLCLFSGLVFGLPAQAQTNFENVIELLATDTENLIAAHLQQSGQEISDAYVLPPKDSQLKVQCEPFSGQVQRLFFNQLSAKLASSRLDSIGFTLRQTVEEGDFAIALSWSRRDDDTLQIISSVGIFTRDNARMKSGGVRVAEIAALPDSAAACIDYDNEVVAYCTLPRPLSIDNSPIPSMAERVARVPAGKEFRVRGAFRNGASLMVSYEARDEQSSAENDFRGFITDDVATLQKWSEGQGGQCYSVNIPKGRYDPTPDQWSDSERFRDCETCPWLKAIPTGETFIGSPRDETGRNPDEDGSDLPIALTRRIAFSVYEITWQEWMECVEAGKCPRPVQLAERNPRDLPASMSFDAAEAFIGWLSEKTGQRYRMPSEAEWEYAARGIPYPDLTQRQPRYHWGDVMLPRHAVCLGCGAEPKAQPVFPSDRPANAFGLNDMHGNLWEWVADCWAEHHLPNEDGSPRGAGRPCATPERVIKGGSYLDDPLALRIANRHHAPETEAHAAIGLRLVREHANNR